MLQTIFTYEWKQLLRSKGLIVALFIFTAIGFFCIKQGAIVYQYQRISVDSAMAKKIRSYDFVKNIFDTIVPFLFLSLNFISFWYQFLDF